MSKIPVIVRIKVEKKAITRPVTALEESVSI